ncbi:hypothetical protein [Methylococcus capsulatus]|uniref:hypothetical protein n=1 Tax=Methylococcus capsulatus TaxID=414 RepID=UPI001C529974|nr:hypothetical protein [Methylococcus capsulatus]QXP89623.1 hypothetical protein KW114_10980 [Methylococcus capsulatus]
MLARDTDWRQGDLLTREAAAALGLVAAVDEERRVIVITHDCDLPHGSELCIEVIVAELVVKEDPQLSYAKNPRRLHIAYEGISAAPLILELRHGDRRSVPKGDFAERAVKDHSLALSIEAKRVLKQWLAARYGRPAFPNEFEERLRKRKVERKIAKILEHDAKYLIGLFFDLGEQRGTEVVEGEPYALSVSVVYDANEGGVDARGAAERVAMQLRELFENTYGKPDVATEIALDACEAVADTYLTLADLRRVDQWRLEYISLRDGEQGDFLPVGEVPV